MKGLLSAVLVLVMVFAIIPLGAVTASAETLSGTTGNCTWTLVDGVLTISGNGAMGEIYDDYYECYISPWAEQCKQVKRIIIKEGVTKIGKGAFGGFTNLEKVSIADSVTEIGAESFAYCDKNKIELLLSENVANIDFSAFFMTKFSIIISGENPYYNSDNGAVFNSDMTEMLYFYYNGLQLDYYKIPEGILKIGDYAFSNNRGPLKDVIIPSGVAVVGDYAFYGICVNEIVLPESVIAIGKKAFADSTIRGITVGSKVEKIGKGAFDTIETLIVNYNGTIEARDRIEKNGDFISRGQTWHFFENNENVVCSECGLERAPIGETLFKRTNNYWYHYIDRIRSYETTLVKYKGKWFYVENGVWQTKATTLVKYKDKWFGVVNGKWNSSTKTLIKYKGKWFYIRNGKWCQDTAIVKYNGKQFYVKNGKVDFDFSGKKKINGKTYKIKNGKVV